MNQSLNLKLASILEKNKLAADQPWLTLLKVVLDPVNNPSDILYLVNNRDDVTYQGQVYTAFNFVLDLVPVTSGGALPQISLSVSNVNRMMQAEVEVHSGAVDADVIIMLVNFGDLTGGPELSVSYGIIGTVCDEEFVIFTLGAPNPLRQIFPKQYYVGTYCRHRYNTPTMQAALDPRGVMCNYSGNLTSCSKLLNDDNGCRAHNNVINFGGQPSIDSNGFRRAIS